MVPTLRWEKGELLLIDQRKLPRQMAWFTARSYRDTIGAIRKMVVRGAPAIGLTAAFGFVLGARALRRSSKEKFMARLRYIRSELEAARPTAVNLRWAMNRLWSELERSLNMGQDQCIMALEACALKMLEEDLRINRLIGEHGSAVVPDKATILTHCNAGALATGGHGTALGVVRSAHQQGKKIRVLVDETRPWLQGHRLTAWELEQEGIEHYVIVDGAAGHFMARGQVDLVITGADRIASNGDTANKIGTYTLAVLAKENNVPFFVAAPISTIDFSISSGQEIKIEERPKEEVLLCLGKRVGAEKTNALNPVFDITPGGLISGIITEKGILRPPYNLSIGRLLEEKV